MPQSGPGRPHPRRSSTSAAASASRVIAIYRRGHTLATRLAGLPLRAGDVLLLQGRPESFRFLADNADLWVLEEIEHQPARRRKGIVVVGIFLAAVVGLVARAGAAADRLPAGGPGGGRPRA